MIFFLNLASFFIWIYLVFFHGRKINFKDPFFWTSKIIFENFFNLDSKNYKKKISIVIPARNEEKSITTTLESILKQSEFISQIIIANDQSTDKTVLNAKKKFKQHNFKNFKILNIEKLPSKWSGKTWALKQGVDEVLKNDSTDYVMLVDSDINLDSDLIIKLAKTMDKKKFSMISLMAQLRCKNKVEKLFIPTFIFFFQKLFPFNRVNDPKNKLAAAAGGCMICRTNIFKKINVFEKIKNKIIDDCNLAKIFKKEGPIWLGLSRKVESNRKYLNLFSIWNMISRCAFEQLNNSIILLCVSVLGLVLIYLFPLFAIFISIYETNYQNLIISLITFFMSIMCYLPTVIFYRKKPFYSLSLPFVSFFYILMTISSAFNYYFKGGNEWKGRKYQNKFKI